MDISSEMKQKGHCPQKREQNDWGYKDILEDDEAPWENHRKGAKMTAPGTQVELEGIDQSMQHLDQDTEYQSCSHRVHVAAF